MESLLKADMDDIPGLLYQPTHAFVLQSQSKKISFGAKLYLHRLGFTLGNRISLYNPG